MLLRVRVSSKLGFHQSSQLNTTFLKNYYFELVVKDGDKLNYVIQCHCQEEDHGHGHSHIHRASPARAGSRQTLPWPEMTHKTPISDAFASAMEIMKIDAQLQIV